MSPACRLAVAAFAGFAMGYEPRSWQAAARIFNASRQVGGGIQDFQAIGIGVDTGLIALRFFS